MQLTRGNAGKCAATVSWQVVEWDGADVQSGTSIIPDSQDSVTATISSVNLNSAFLIFGSASIGTDQGMDSNLILGNISSQTQLSFTLKPGITYGSSQRTVVWYVVEPPAAAVQSGYTSLGSDTTETVSSVDVNKSFHISSGWNTGGGQSYSNSLHTISLTDATTLTLDKQTGSQTQNIFWYLITVGEPSIYWNQSSLSLGSDLAASGDRSADASIIAMFDHTNIIVNCGSGNCSIISDDWSDGSSLPGGSSQDINFTCDNSTIGVFSATYSVSSDEDSSLDTITVTCDMLADTYVIWNRSTLDLGTATEFTGNLVSLAEVFSNSANNDVNVSCSGSCSQISSNWTNDTDMSDQEALDVEFTCLDTTVGNFSALFDIVSTEDQIPDTINVSCTILETNFAPQITLDYPPDLSEIFVDTTIFQPEIDLNTTVTDSNDDLMCVEIFGSNSSPPSDTELLYEICGISNNTQVSYSWTSPVRADTSGIY